MYVLHKTADVVYSCNSTILSVSNLNRTSDKSFFNAEDLFLVLNNTFYTDLNSTSLDPNYVSSFIIRCYSIVLASGPTDWETAVESAVSQLLESFLVTPLVFFQPVFLSHFNGNHYEPGRSQTISYSFTDTANRLVIAKWTITAYSAIAMIVYFWCDYWLIWSVIRPCPPGSKFPLLDFAMRTSVLRVTTGVHGDDYKEVREKLWDKRVYLRGKAMVEGMRFTTQAYKRVGDSDPERIGFPFAEENG